MIIFLINNLHLKRCYTIEIVSKYFDHELVILHELQHFTSLEELVPVVVDFTLHISHGCDNHVELQQDKLTDYEYRDYLNS